MLIQPINKEIKGKTFILSKFPAVAGREIVANYPFSGLPKVGDYKLNEATMLKLMCYVAVPIEGRPPLQLMTRELVDNHVTDWEVLAQLEYEMMAYNCSFFKDGRASDFLDGLAQKAEALIIRILTNLSERSSPTNTPPSLS
jgi:hypothetical protein